MIATSGIMVDDATITAAFVPSGVIELVATMAESGEKTRVMRP